MISAVILTKNEEENIVDCIQSLDWCDEIIIIDDYSQDSTIYRVRNFLSGNKNKLNLKIFQHKLNDDFAAQRNFGMDKASGDWILYIDADERISDRLRDEIIKVTQNHAVAGNCVGFYIQRKDYFLGSWLEHGETADIKLLRLARRGSGEWWGRAHEKWIVKGITGTLDNCLGHYSHSRVGGFLAKVNTYSSLVAGSWVKEKKKMYTWEIFIYPLGKFIYNYFWKLGFLDGVPGFIMAMMMSFHSFLARGKYWLLTGYG